MAPNRRAQKLKRRKVDRVYYTGKYGRREVVGRLSNNKKVKQLNKQPFDSVSLLASAEFRNYGKGNQRYRYRVTERAPASELQVWSLHRTLAVGGRTLGAD